MNLLSKEYRAIFAASIFALLSTGAGGVFLWKAAEERDAAALELQKNNKEYGRIRSDSPAPTEDSFKQLELQAKAAEDSEKELFAAFTAMTIPLSKIQPQEFQTSLNTKTQSFIAKAAKNKVSIPRGAKESEPFSMDFDEFIKKVPSEEKAPLVNRQLVAADRLLNTLLDSKPLSLISFKIDRQEDAKDAQKDGRELKADPKSGKSPQPRTAVRVLEALGFDLKFTASPDSFRDFINALTRDNQALFVVRKLKVTTLSKEGVPMLAPSKTFVAAPIEAATPGQPQAPAIAQYILGDEHVEVELRVDLLQIAKPALEAPPKLTGAEGQTLRHQIVAANHPTSFEASGLAPGLSLDRKTGLVSGTLTTEGVYSGTLFATNTSGTMSQSFEVTVKKRGAK